MSCIRHGIVVDPRCIWCLVSSKQFATLQLPQKCHLADPRRARTEYPTLLEKIGKVRGKRHASTRRREVSLGIQPLSKLSLSWVLSFSENKSHSRDLFPEDVYYLISFGLLQNLLLRIYQLLKNCFVSHLSSGSLLTGLGHAVCCRKMFHAQEPATLCVLALLYLRVWKDKSQ